MDRNRVKLNNGSENEYTLESILAEFKGDAYIQGQKKLSKADLAVQAEQIVAEMTRAADKTEPQATPDTGESHTPPERQVYPERHGQSEANKRMKPERGVQPERRMKPEPRVQKEQIAGTEKTNSQRAEEDEQVREYIPGSKRRKPDMDIDADMKIRPDPVKAPRPGEVIKAEKKESHERIRKGDSRAEKDYEKKRELQSRKAFQRQIIRERELEHEESEARYLAMSDDEQEFFGVGKYAREEAVFENRQEVDRVIEREAERRRRSEERANSRRNTTTGRSAEKSGDLDSVEDIEMSPADAIKVYTSGIPSLRLKCMLAFLICIVMAYFMFAPGFGFAIPKSFAGEPKNFALFLLILELIVIFMGLDILKTGIADLLTLNCGAESLVAVSCIVSIIDAVSIFISGNASAGLPYCAVSAFSLLCAMWGRKLGKSAFHTTYKTVALARTPYIIAPEWEKVDSGIVLAKHLGTIKGFINKSTELDRTEITYQRISPLLIIASLVFSLLSTVFKGQSQYFLHAFAAMTAISASFSSMLSFNLIFSAISNRLAGSGSAIAGWGGVCDINDAVGMVIRDLDLFPETTLSLNGVKVFSDFSVERIVAYTGSMILASGSGLTGLFADLLKEYGCGILRVDEFSCYEGGGIGALINHDKVLVGSAAFMNLMGIRLAQNLNIKSAVFTAVNDNLAGVFIVNYMPVDTVQNALVSLIRSKITPLFAVRDFNITPAVMKNKFKISTDDIEFMTFEKRYNLSATSENTNVKPAAIMSREGLGHFLEIVKGGRQISFTAKASVFISAFGAILGLLIMFFIIWNGAYVSASAVNVLTYMLMWLIPVLLLSAAGKRY